MKCPGRLGEDLTDSSKEISLKIYTEAAAYAETRDVIICDTQVRFGLVNGQLTLVDEVLTPDSSRFWPRDAYAPGRPQPSFDKQFVRRLP